MVTDDLIVWINICKHKNANFLLIDAKFIQVYEISESALGASTTKITYMGGNSASNL